MKTRIQASTPGPRSLLGSHHCDYLENQTKTNVFETCSELYLCCRNCGLAIQVKFYDKLINT